MTPNLPDFLETEQTLTDFLESFEQGTWPKSAWTHAAHVAVASCYLIECPDQDAADLMRRGIIHYNQCVGTINNDHSGYHETITLFWLAIVKARLRDLAVRDAVVRVRGSGDAQLGLVSSLDAEVLGSGDVTYAGSPKIVRQVVRGSGSISQR